MTLNHRQTHLDIDAAQSIEPDICESDILFYPLLTIWPPTNQRKCVNTIQRGVIFESRRQRKHITHEISIVGGPAA